MGVFLLQFRLPACDVPFITASTPTASLNYKYYNWLIGELSKTVIFDQIEHSLIVLENYNKSGRSLGST